MRASLSVHDIRGQKYLPYGNMDCEVFKEGKIIVTVFPQIVSVETILFWIWPYVLRPLVTVHKSAEIR